MNIYLDSQIVVQTEVEWAADTEVYSELRILVSSDVYYGATDQRKFKLANGVDTWSNLDYMPIGTGTSGGVQSVTGDGVDNTDPLNPVITFPTPSEIGAEPAKGTDDNYVTDAQLVVIGNTSGTNTGDNATNTQYSGLSTSKEDSSNKSNSQLDIASTTKFPVWAAVVTYITGLGYLLASTAASTYQAILTATNFGSFLTGLTSKTTVVDTDEFVISDSAASNVAKKLTGTNFKAYLKTYFDTLYTTTSAVATQITTALSGYLTSATAASTYAPIASPTLTGIATIPAIIVSSETASRVAIIDASKNVKSADTTTYPSLTELAYIKGATSAIQTQINNTLKYTSTFRTSSANPADATTYFLGLLPGQAVALAENQRRSKFPITGTITDVCFTIQQTNNATTETVTIKLKNITTATAYTIGTFTSDFGASTVVSFIYTGLTIPVGNTTDYWTFQIDAPTWATNPTAWLIAADCNVR